VLTRAKSIPSRKGKKQQRGSQMIELAFTLVPLLSLIFGIIDVAMFNFLRSTFQHAVREGTRYAVTYRTGTNNGAPMGHDSSIKAIVTQNAMGFLSSSSAQDKIQIKYFTPNTFVETGANAPGNIIEVAIRGYQWGWIAPLWSVLRAGGYTPNAFTINARALARMESPGAGNPVPGR
jgi:hypothetical protein